MPLIETRQLASHIMLGLWHISEEAPTPRQRERLATRNLLCAMTGDDTITIDHEPSGKPFLKSQFSTLNPQISNLNPQISISHTRGFAAAMLSYGVPVGIDIEYISDRVDRIAPRFIHPEEKAETTLQRLLLWSAKETVYKLYSEDKLAFFDMRLRGMDSQVMHIEQRKREIVVDVHFEHTNDYVLTFATEAVELIRIK